MRCKHCLCLDCCNMNEPQRILVNTNFPKLRPLLAIERSNGNHHWFCEKACDMTIGHRHYAHSPLKKAEAEASKQETDRIGFLAYHQKTAI